MGRVPYAEFVGSRVRLQRLRDQAIFPAWLKALKNHSVHVDSEENLPLVDGERFLFQVQGPSADAYFIAQCSGQPATPVQLVEGATALQTVLLPAFSYEFCVLSHIQLKDMHQRSRKIVHSVNATLEAAGHESEVLIADAGNDGMGVVVWTELNEGDLVTVRLDAKGLKSEYVCVVRHCRPEPRLTGAYRAGLQFQQPDRLFLTAWRKLINPL